MWSVEDGVAITVVNGTDVTCLIPRFCHMFYHVPCHLHDNTSATYHTTNGAISGRYKLVNIIFFTELMRSCCLS